MDKVNILIENVTGDRLNVVWGIILLVVFLIFVYMLFKFISFLVSVVITMVVLGVISLYLLNNKELSVGNFYQLNSKTTEILLVGKDEGCEVYWFNEKVSEYFDISDWKVKLQLCEKAKKKVLELEKDDTFRKLMLRNSDNPDCPMVFLTSRNRVFNMMEKEFENKNCKIPQILMEIVKDENENKKEEGFNLKDLIKNIF